MKPTEQKNIADSIIDTMKELGNVQAIIAPKEGEELTVPTLVAVPAGLNVKDVTEGLQNFMRDLKAQGAIVNFEVYPDPELNTASQLEQGRVYWNIRFTDVPPAENPQFRVEVTNQWITEVLDITN